MSFLLDTHTFLRFVNDHSSLSPTAKDFIKDQQSLVYPSAANIWEMAINSSLRRLALPASLQQFIETYTARNDFGILQITAAHAETVAKLPFPESGHRDPLYRMIVAQAICHDLTIIARDAAFSDYPIQRIWQPRAAILEYRALLVAGAKNHLFPTMTAGLASSPAA